MRIQTVDGDRSLKRIHGFFHPAHSSLSTANPKPELAPVGADRQRLSVVRNRQVQLVELGVSSTDGSVKIGIVRV